jgi:quercetin dioxygenase-like cupin family protein
MPQTALVVALHSPRTLAGGPRCCPKVACSGHKTRVPSHKTGVTRLPTPASIDTADLPDERWDDPARGTITFRTLVSAPRTDSNELVCGVAMMAKGDTFVLHSHPQAEVYFGLEGEGDVMIDGVAHRLVPGVALYIPGGAVHGIPVAKANLKWFYTFAADSFSQIQYHFPHESPA